MSDIKNITLAFPCRERLTQHAAGAFYCDRCAHTVVDFRCQSAESLQAAMQQSTRPVCGIFKKSQMSEQFLRYAAATAIAALAMTGTMCATDPQPDQVNSSEVSEEVAPLVGVMVPSAETWAAPVGGYRKFKSDLERILRYPRGFDVVGTVYVQFTVDTSGKTKDFKVMKGIHEAADREAVRAIESLNYLFEPAQLGGRVMESKVVMPVRFSH